MKKLAHDNSEMDCQICHSSWVTSCFGCHLPMKADERVTTNKFEGTVSRNFTTYNPQVVRDDVFMLGLDGTVRNHRLAVIRSSSAVLVGSQNANREWVYSQQQTVSSEGYSGQAFNPHFPHTTSGVGTTKNCTDCHLAANKDNNAIMAQLLGFGTGTVNFFGRFAYVGAGEGGFYAVTWTEQDETAGGDRQPSPVDCLSAQLRGIRQARPRTSTMPTIRKASHLWRPRGART